MSQGRGSVDPDSSRTTMVVDTVRSVRWRGVTTAGASVFSPRSVGCRSAIEAPLALIETRQQNHPVVERPHAIVDLFEPDRLSVQGMAQKQPPAVLPLDHPRVIDLAR